MQINWRVFILHIKLDINIIKNDLLRQYNMVIVF